MTHKKNKKHDQQYYEQYDICRKDAINIVKQRFDDTHLVVDPTSIYIVWFAFTHNGYHCMVTSKIYKNNFFEITKNMKTNEMVCLVLQQVECIVHPGEKQHISILPNNIQDLIED